MTRSPFLSFLKVPCFGYLRHSGSMHFSVCSSSSEQPAGSDFSILWRVLKPRPHVTLQSLQSDQGDSMQGRLSANEAQASQQVLLPLGGPIVANYPDKLPKLPRKRHEARQLIGPHVHYLPHQCACALQWRELSSSVFIRSLFCSLKSMSSLLSFYHLC